jgi:hypothetical protein
MANSVKCASCAGNLNFLALINKFFSDYLETPTARSLENPKAEDNILAKFCKNFTDMKTADGSLPMICCVGAVMGTEQMDKYLSNYSPYTYTEQQIKNAKK